MNKCLRFFRTDGFVKITACDNVENELKRLSNYQYNKNLRRIGIIEECPLLLSVDNADMLRDCICSIFSISKYEECNIYIDDYYLIQILSNNECTYYEDSVGRLLDRILRQRKIYKFLKSYDGRVTIKISELIPLKNNYYKDNNGFILFKDGLEEFCPWYLIIENDKIPFGLSIDSNTICQLTGNGINLSENRFVHRMNEKYFEKYIREYTND